MSRPSRSCSSRLQTLTSTRFRWWARASGFSTAAGKPIDVSRYRRDKLAVGARRSGPAIIAEEETSTFVTENFDAWIDGLGSIVMERKGITA